MEENKKEYLIGKISSYNNEYDLENRFSELLKDQKIISKSDLNNLLLAIEKAPEDHKRECKEGEEFCGYGKKFKKAIFIIEEKINNIKKEEYNAFKTTYLGPIIVAVIVAVITFLLTKI